MDETRHWGEHSGPVLDSVDEYEVIDCQRCLFRHIVPIPTAEELVSIYREGYYSTEKPLYIEQHTEDLEWWNVVYGDRFAAFEALLSPDRRQILDVGSGPGYFLQHGEQRGWKGLGIEPSRQAATHSRGLGLTILERPLTADLVEELPRFDVVHLSEVLEHLPDPGETLRIVRSLLAPGGLVCVVVPNDYNPIQHAYRGIREISPWWIAPPHHVNYFNFESLGRLLTDCGFRVVLREATFPIDLFLLMGDEYIGHPNLGRACHDRRKSFEVNLARSGFGALRRELYQAFAASGIGREALVIGRSDAPA